jgi:beta-ureidopropionase
MPSRRRRVGFAAIQMAISPKKEKNVQAAIKLIEKSSRKYSPEIIGLPELFSTPFFPFYRKKDSFKLAEEIPGPTTTKLGRLARELGIFLIAPIFEKSNGTYYDSSPIISPSGDVAHVYRKSSIPETVWKSEGVVNHEKFFFHPGQGFETFDTGFCRVGQLICYDRHFPEGWRTLAKNGAQVVYIPNASVGNKISEMFTLETRAMSKENGVYSIVSNRIGKEGPFHFFGGTHVVNPAGECIAGPSRDFNDIVFSNLDLR